MKKIQTLISVGAVAAVTALPVFAQQTAAQYTTNRMGNETAMDIAQRVGACSESRIATASFDSDSLIRVTCAGAGGLDGGLSTGAAIGGAVAAVALIGLSSDGSGSTTTTTTTTTTGTTN